MTAPLVAVILTAGCTILFTLLLVTERRRNVRALSGMRTALDSFFARSGEVVHMRMPRIHRGFFRNIFHYLTHRLLSAGILVVRKIEAGLTRIAHINKKKALDARKQESGSHLGEIARHKQDTALSDEEREQRKDDALNGK